MRVKAGEAAPQAAKLLTANPGCDRPSRLR